MTAQIGFIVKILLVSTVLSFLIKYGGRLLPIAPTSFNALVAILTPPLLMLLVLAWPLKKN